jgi:hypothetical protein
MNITFYKFSILTLLISFQFNLFGKNLMQQVNPSRIEQTCIINLIKKFDETGIHDFSILQPSVDKTTDTRYFDSNTHIFHNSHH